MLSKICSHIAASLSSRSGAVTVDFVVLTAGIITLFLLVIQPIYSGSRGLVDEINTMLVSHASTMWD
ncbi:MAG: hypothetical protein ACJARE_001470 [Paracoccaceae bacterium]|jgi:hypothetical protein